MLAADGDEEKFKTEAKSEDEIIALLNEVQLEADLDASLVQLLFPASDMVQMSAVARQPAKNTGCTWQRVRCWPSNKNQLHLGQDSLWLLSSDKGVTHWRIVCFQQQTIVSTKAAHRLKTAGAFAACNSAHRNLFCET